MKHLDELYYLVRLPGRTKAHKPTRVMRVVPVLIREELNRRTKCLYPK